MYDTTLSQKYVKDIGLCKKKNKKNMHIQRRYATCFGLSKKKRIKDAYPKKVCHMLRHVKKKYSPLSKKKEKERDGAYKGVHTPSTKNIHTLAHLDQGLWLVSSLDPVFNLAKYEKQVCLQILNTYSSTKIAIRDRLRKKGTIKALVRNYTLWAIWEIIRGTL